jgi:hypothetical protein
LQQITILAKNNEISREMYSKIQFLSEKFTSRSKFLLKTQNFQLLTVDSDPHFEAGYIVQVPEDKFNADPGSQHCQYGSIPICAVSIYRRYLYRNNRSLHS